MGKVYKNGLTVITAIFGDYDDVPPIPAGFDYAVLVSDRPINSAWQNIVIDTQFNSFLGSKIPKFRPDLFCKQSILCGLTRMFEILRVGST